MAINFYTLFWRDGTSGVIKGESPEDAFTKAGYGGGAFSAIDFYSEGVDLGYYRDHDLKEWVKKVNHHAHIDTVRADHAFTRDFIRSMIDKASYIAFDLDNKDQLVIEKKSCHFAHGWTNVISIHYDEHANGSYGDPSEEGEHWMVTSIEYEDPDNLEQAIERVMKRLDKPYRPSGIPSANLERLSIKQGFSEHHG